MSEREGPLGPAREDEDVFERSLRPQSFGEYVGQSQLKENLSIAIAAARGRGEPLDHVLLHGPPGLGKTSLAHLIAREMGAELTSTSGPAIERAGDLAAILTRLSEGDVFFIDEVHRLNRVVEEVLYPAMEDGAVDLVVGKGIGASNVKLTLKPFTLVVATTRVGLLSSPLRDRFGSQFRLDFYAPPELEVMLERSARLLDVELLSDGAAEIARRSRGTPRIANRLLARARDWAQVKGDGVIDAKNARAALQREGVDERGLDRMDQTLLTTIIDKFSGGPVGLGTLAAAVGEEADTIEEVYEPFLIREGLLMRQPRGRVATPEAFRHLDRRLTPAAQGALFDGASK